MNTNPKDAWYHCGHCGSLFQSDYGFDEDRLCEVCHRKPGVGLWPAVNSVDPVASAKVAGFHKTGDKVRIVARTPSSKNRRFRRVFLFTLIWILILLGAVGLRYYLTKDSDKPKILSFSDLRNNLSEKDKEKILNQVLPECDRSIRGFLSAQTIEERVEFITRSAELKAAVEAHDKDQPFAQVDASKLERTAEEWIRLGDEWMILTQWKDAEGDNVFDAVFRKEADRWKLDWPHFSRYSEASWKSFIAGEGESDQAVFRLLAKKQKDTDAPRLNDQRMMIVLAAPVWGKPEQAVTESPMISIDLSSEDGELLKAAFELREKNLTVGGSKLAPLDPEGFVRVHVKLSRDELGGEFRLILNELKTCHWIDSNRSGF